MIKKRDIKILAFHLPQFHTFPENDKWWGKGFTEWVNTKKSVPLFEEHYQPRTPLNNNFYDLSKKEDIRWQMLLAQKYKIYGFCYYHYWFNGKILMEKPLKLMRTMPERIPYCFCWANEPWTRAWDGKNKEVLMPQEYGEKQEWRDHIEYLYQFFDDEKYIKIDNKPVLLIYKSSSIEKCNQMIDFWNEECIKHGFSGIYIVEERNAFQKEKFCNNSSAVLDFEPMYTVKYGRNIFLRIKDKLKAKVFNKKYNNNMLIYNYDDIWKCILKRGLKERSNFKKYLGAFVDWDNSARKRKKSLLFYGANPSKFGKYMKELVNISSKNDSEFIFINAWNEWAEGTYLEPDTKWEYKYLQEIKDLYRE